MKITRTIAGPTLEIGAAPEEPIAARVDALVEAKRAPLFNADDARPHAGEPGRAIEGTPTFVAIGARPFLPKADRLYETEVRWRGKTHTVQFSADEGVVEHMRKKGYELDLPALAMRALGKTSHRLLDRGWETTLDQAVALGDVPRQLAKEPVLATKVRVVSDGRSARGTLNISIYVEDHQSDLDVFSSRTDSSRRPTSIVPLPIGEKDLARRSLGDGIEISGLTERSLEAVQPSIDAVLGKTLARWSEHREGIRREVEQLSQRAKELIRNVVDLKEFEREYGAVLMRKAELEMKLAPIEIVVVPKGRHFTVMPQAADQRERLLATEIDTLGLHFFVGEAKIEGASTLKRLVFIPEDDVLTQRHELYHLIEHAVLSDEQTAAIDRLYDRSVKGRGPFARPYGMQRREFFTTWAELFEGSGGVEGLRYLEEKASPILEIIRDVTGR